MKAKKSKEDGTKRKKVEVEIVDMSSPQILKQETETKQSKKGKKRKSESVKQATPDVKQPKITGGTDKQQKKKKIQEPVHEIQTEKPKKKKNSGKNKKGKHKTLFIGGLDTKVSREAIADFFTKHNITLYEVRKKNGRRFCHVDLLNPDDLEKALALNGKKIDDCKVKINAEKTHFDVKEIEVKSQTIFVKNIEPTVSKDALRDLFPGAVNIKYPKTMSGKNKGFAYIKMDSIDKVKEYLKKKNLELKGQRLILDTVEVGGRHSKILRVRNMNFETTEETLKSVFEDSSSVKLCLNAAGKSQGTAIVTFETIEAAKQAQKEKHKEEVDGRNIIVTFIEDIEQPNTPKKKKFGKEDRYGRKKSSAYEKRRKPSKVVKKSDGKQKSFKKSPA